MVASAAYRNPFTASGAPVSPSRMAGTVVEQNPRGWGSMLMELFGGYGTQAKDAVKGVTQGTAQGARGLNTSLAANLAKNTGRLAAGSGALALIGAATEFADPDDPVLRNAAQAAGNFGGTLGGVGAGAALGTAILPGIGTVIGGTLGGYFGSRGGSGLGGGIYDLVTNETPEARNRKNRIRDAAVDRQIAVADEEAMMPLLKQAMEVKRADQFARAERDLAIQNEYNFANAVNQAMLNGQQQRSLQNLALTQYMLG